jgi:glycosyltransferase involved in cell wall biosynthesis
VICPPVDTEFYTPAAVPREDFYLVVSALAPYKRFDLAIGACEQLGRKLVVIGKGQDLARLKATAGPNVSFLGWQSDEVIRDHLRRAKALLFPGEEDFGIVPLEAQACGCPVIAFGRGGTTETVRPLGDVSEPTGVFFAEQTVESLIDGIERFESDADRFDPRAARRQAVLFRKERFESELFGYLDRVMSGTVDEVRKAA